MWLFATIHGNVAGVTYGTATVHRGTEYLRTNQSASHVTADGLKTGGNVSDVGTGIGQSIGHTTTRDTSASDVRTS